MQLLHFKSFEFQISDRGGGFAHGETNTLFKYLFTTAKLPMHTSMHTDSTPLVSSTQFCKEKDKQNQKYEAKKGREVLWLGGGGNRFANIKICKTEDICQKQFGN